MLSHVKVWEALPPLPSSWRFIRRVLTVLSVARIRGSAHAVKYGISQAGARPASRVRCSSSQRDVQSIRPTPADILAADFTQRLRQLTESSNKLVGDLPTARRFLTPQSP